MQCWKLNIVARFRSNANDGRLLFYDFIDMCWDKQIKSEIEENDKEMNGGGLERIERLGSHRVSYSAALPLIETPLGRQVVYWSVHLHRLHLCDVVPWLED